MKSEQNKPEFGLSSLNGLSESPQVFKVETKAPQTIDRRVDRRKFLSLGVGLPAAAVMGAFLADRAAGAGAMIIAHRAPVTAILFSRDGTILLSSSPGDGMKKWQLPGGTFQGAVLDPTTAGSDVVRSSNGRMLAGHSAGSIWVSPFEIPAPSRVFVSGVVATALSPDAKWLAYSDGLEVGIYSLGTGTSISGNPGKKLEGRSGPITHVAITGNLLISGSREGRLCTWSFPEGEPIGQFETGQLITSMILIGEGKTIATGHPDGTIRVTPLTNGGALTSFQAGSRIVSLALGLDNTLISGAQDGTVDIWSLSTGTRTSSTRVEFAQSLVQTTKSDQAVSQLSALASLAVPDNPIIAVGGGPVKSFFLKGERKRPVDTVYREAGYSVHS